MSSDSPARGGISRAEVAHLARLARLAVTDRELDVFAGQLDVILGAVARVGEVAADEIPPTSHAIPLQNTFRPDQRRPSLTQEQALSGAPATEDGRFRVPRILDDEPPMGSSLTEPDVVEGRPA
ncbi:MAG: gatC [Pseudonocardia sp.]|jgi:aspartyl-tRNA(Asn)/glutamyl-tRNA(Gln) amidotransferase subunit C|nr:gatC [Pseudonocardia sp.]